MYKNIYKIAFRNIMKRKWYTITNILGLALGMACAIFLFSWIHHELSFDKFHHRSDSIYRLTSKVSLDQGDQKHFIFTCPLLISVLRNEFPEINAVTHLGWIEEILVRHRKMNFIEKSGLYTDSSFFRIFNFSLLIGTAETALQNPRSILMTEKLAKKYFGNEEAIGKNLIINGEDHVVTGIIQNPPLHSHLNFNFIISSTDNPLFTDIRWSWFTVVTYISLKPDVEKQVFENKLQSLSPKYGGEWFEKNYRFGLQSIHSIHLHSDLLGEFSPRTSILTIYIFLTIGLLILLVACINFINLTIAIFNQRTKEVWIRKALGAERWLIFVQFMGEIFILVLLSLVVSFLMVRLLNPVFALILPGEFHLLPAQGFYLVIGLTFLVALLSGIFPATFFSALPAYLLMQNNTQKINPRPIIRQTLIVFQLIVAIILFIGTGCIYSQINYILNKDVGFDKQQLLRISITDPKMKPLLQTLKDEFSRMPDIRNVTASSSLPFDQLSLRAFRPEDAGNTEISAYVLLIDLDFLSTLGIPLKEGRNFLDMHEKGYIINEAAAKLFGWDTPIGKRLEWAAGDRLETIDKSPVVGVVKNFHFENFYSEIRPLVMRIRPEYYTMITIRYQTMNLSEMLIRLEKVWCQFDPNCAFNCTFVDDLFFKSYHSENRLSKGVLYLSFVSIWIACIGLLGHIFFMAQQKTREIGIRKVNGASKLDIIIQLNKEFLKLFIISNLIAWPLGYYFTYNWLNNFAYRISINLLTFLSSSFVVLLIAILTIGYHSIKAASINPIEILKYE